MEEESSNVIQFPLNVERLCDNCDHASFSSHGIFCLMYREEIWTPELAEECESYEPIPHYSARTKS